MRDVRHSKMRLTTAIAIFALLTVALFPLVLFSLVGVGLLNLLYIGFAALDISVSGSISPDISVPSHLGEMFPRNVYYSAVAIAICSAILFVLNLAMAIQAAMRLFRPCLFTGTVAIALHIFISSLILTYVGNTAFTFCNVRLPPPVTFPLISIIFILGFICLSFLRFKNEPPRINKICLTSQCT